MSGRVEGRVSASSNRFEHGPLSDPRCSAVVVGALVLRKAGGFGCRLRQTAPGLQAVPLQVRLHDWQRLPSTSLLAKCYRRTESPGTITGLASAMLPLASTSPSQTRAS